MTATLIRQIGRGLTTALIAVSFTAGSAAALDPGVKCEFLKNKEAGKYAFCLQKAQSKFVKKGDAGKLASDIAKCESKFSLKWGKAEDKGKGMCPTSGDEAGMQSFIDAHSAEVTAALGGGGLPACGDDAINVAGEQCDGTDLGGEDCTTLGYASGTLVCSSCSFDTAGCDPGCPTCATCTNGTAELGEECDNSDLRSETCQTQGFSYGTLACTGSCTLDTSGCTNTRFADNADGTITDNDGGLEWEKKVKLDSTTDLANLQDADNLYAWAGTCSVATSKRCQPDAASSAACFAGAEADTTGCDECTGGDGTCGASDTIWTWLVDLNTASFGGHGDWRIPTREELVTIVDYFDTSFSPLVDVAFDGVSCGGACTDVTDPACSCTRSYFYWSASSLAPTPVSAWLVSFYSGYVSYDSKTFTWSVRAVRGGL